MLKNLLRSFVGDPRITTREQELAETLESLNALIGRLDTVTTHTSKLMQLSLAQIQTTSIGVRAQILADSRFDDPLRLERHGFKVYSQNEEDGIIAEIFRRIGVTNRRFLEFGVEVGLECNTLYLLIQGWRGAWLESNDSSVAAMHRRFQAPLATGQLTLRETMVDRENINRLAEDLKLPSDLDLLSIDIDGNDYHVWKALTAIQPRVVVIEYNAKFPPPTPWVMQYDPHFRWEGSDQFGASLQSLTELASHKGYQLVACNITGSNAFFVRSDVAGNLFALPAETATFYQPARYFLTLGFVSGHMPDFGRGSET